MKKDYVTDAFTDDGEHVRVIVSTSTSLKAAARKAKSVIRESGETRTLSLITREVKQ